MALLASLTGAAGGKSQARHASRGAPDADAWQEQLLLAFQLLLQTVGKRHFKQTVLSTPARWCAQTERQSRAE